jgi:hypothetical protein
VIQIDDFVMLGKTVPEPSSDGRVFVCSAGVSPQLARLGGLLRIYPLARRGTPARWSVNRVELEQNGDDQRRESWKLAGDRSPGAHEHINNTFVEQRREYPASGRADLLKPYTVESLREANDRKLSLAVLHPAHVDFELKFNPDSPDSPQMALFDLEVKKVEAGAKRFPYIPRLRIWMPGVDHDIQEWLPLRDWGCFEYMRKHPDADGAQLKSELPRALHLDADASLLVGNFNRFKNRWLVISVLRGLRAAPSLFDEIDDLEHAGVA